MPTSRRSNERFAIGFTALTIAVGVAVVLSSAAEVADKREWSREVKKAFKSITAKECLDHVKILADDDYLGRAAGEEGGRLAALYMANRFSEMGLEPGGTNGQYFQPFQLNIRQRKEGDLSLTNQMKLAKKKGSKTDSLKYGIDFLPDPRSGKGRAYGKAVFVKSIASELDLTDKVVLLFDDVEVPEIPEQRPFAQLAKRGARGVVLLSPGKGDWSPKDAEWPAGESSTSAEIPVLRLTLDATNKLLRKSGTSLKKLAKLEEDKELRSGYLDFEASRRGWLFGLGRNVIGILPGKDSKLKEEAVVIGAHFDHVGKPRNRQVTRGRIGEIHNGADDNASGSSGLIELAEAFAESDLQYRRTLIFMGFDAEELGLVGSKYFCSNPTFPMEKIVAMINMDMISRNEGREMYIGKMDKFAGLNDIVEGVALSFGIHLNPDGMEKYMMRSDQASFIEKGVPAVFLYGGDHNEYHTERDDVHLINPRKIEAISQLMFLCAWECANHEGSFR